MPVTAKLSRRFYEQFGDELTNELVEWFNSVDATYQSDLKELNEFNFVRFDAKLEQRIAAVDAKIDGLEAKVDRRIGVLEAKVDRRIGVLEAKMDQRFAVLEEKLEKRFAVLEEKLDKRFAVFEVRIIRWTLTLWTGTMLAFVGLLVAVLRSK